MTDLLPYQTSHDITRVELEHGWEFLPDRSARLRYDDLGGANGWRPARVGLSWNAQFEDLRDYMGAAWYRMHAEVPVFRDTRHALLKFGAVDYFCEVFINGISVGTHEGGYTPFSFDITAAIRPGDNEIAVYVIDPPMNEVENRALFPEMLYNEIPHGKQNWYVQNAGIWQGVRLEFCPAIYIDRVDVTPNRSGDFEAVVRLAGIGFTADQGKTATETELRFDVYDASGRRVFQHRGPVGPDNVTVIKGNVPNPRLWAPDDPHLYLVDVSLAGAVRYRRKYRFGFRSFEARDGKFYLNGKPFYMIAALDQDFYPETIHTPASAEFVRDMMLKAKKLGINVLRCHLKVAHPVYLDTADELGMLVWAEMPSWSDCWFPCDHFSMRAALRGEKMFEEVLTRDWNHPCIVVNTIMNESWGINLKQEEQRRWLKDAFERVKHTMEPLGRLVVDNSACEGNFHIKTDIEDFHQYYSMPDQTPLWDKWLAELASRPEWTFSPYGDAERTGKEVLMVSEFGNWGLPRLPEDEQLPWWFHYSFGGREVTTPSGVFDRFREFKFAPLFTNYNDFAEESQWHQFISLKYEIESIRSQPSIEGYVVTAMTDVHWEVNGILDMWRNMKVFAEPLSHVQKQDVVIAHPGKLTCFGPEELEARVLVSHYSDRDLRGAKLRWVTESGASGVLDVGEVESGTVKDLGVIRWKTPEVSQATVERVYLQLRSKNGSRLAENFCEVFVMASLGISRVPIRLHGVKQTYPELETALEQAGYELDAQGRSSIVVASKLDERVMSILEDGGRVILLADSEDALPASLNINTKARAGSELDGRWFSNFNWIRTDRAPFRDVAFGRVLGFESAGVVPDYVIQGVPGADYNEVLAAATFGWLQKTSALAVQYRVGEGGLFVTTFRFHNYGRDAYATALLDAIVRYVASDEFAPTLQLTRVADHEQAR
jgi:Glycosyl hydrolases family 2, sugar binding domain/Glycosyl hydrolases family 2/Glycosyl hydrolases family 2, TIM barrel domain